MKNVAEPRVFSKDILIVVIFIANIITLNIKELIIMEIVIGFVMNMQHMVIKLVKAQNYMKKELDKIFKNVYSYLINNFDEIKGKLINIYKNSTFNACNEIEKIKKGNQ